MVLVTLLLWCNCHFIDDFSVAIIDDIYRDKSLKWRNIHIILNCLALLLFIGQGYTGARDLFEIGLWSPPFMTKMKK